MTLPKPGPSPELREARRLLGVDPVAAVEYARRAVAVEPQSFETRFLLGAALRRSGEISAACAVLAPLATVRPAAWGLHYEYGTALAALGRSDLAIAALERATSANPQSSLAWHALGDQLALRNRTDAAVAAQMRVVPGYVGDAALAEVASALFTREDPRARAALWTRFGVDLNDVAAVRLLADIGMRLGHFAAVEPLLAAAVATAPAFAPARFSLALTLHRLERGAEALTAIEPVVEAYPGSAMVVGLQAAIHMQLGNVAQAIDAYEGVVRTSPEDSEMWHAYGHALRAIGRQSDAVAAYRRAIAIAPGSGEAWWSLANLKTVRFDAEDIARMQALPEAASVNPGDRAYLDFALGKALEDERRYAEAFDHYARGNAARKRLEPHDAAAHRCFVTQSIAAFDTSLFARAAGAGCDAIGPIFVVGMPRSGSTLVEQILASHSQVEGASELPTLTALARDLAVANPGYPASLSQVPPETFAELGRAYLKQTEVYRSGDRPLFVDKFPGNFLHGGLIHLMLPNARIIDVRRDPVACCFSIFKQAFARGQAYSYDLEDLAHYYRDYVALMAHFEAVLPGRVHRIVYEDLVDDAESEIRRLLDHCGLAFEPHCLRFFETGRNVRTPSSEQVRRPIFRDALDQWRGFEPWLGPLIETLGPLARPVTDRP
ncbi:MAG: tetratricopeptide repeat-containing sulfotransferase family protein [Sphingomonas sp.]|uniref:tetratricopeptide repeat-containing sulfotransferase family protein n=1 Tax=Sphingomonas sp. TaxID=28214 RepID=UPI0030F8CDC9